MDSASQATYTPPLLLLPTQFGKCEPCPSSRGSALGIVIGSVLLLLLTAAILFYLTRRYAWALTNVQTLGKVLINFSQVIASAASIYDM